MSEALITQEMQRVSEESIHAMYQRVCGSAAAGGLSQRVFCSRIHVMYGPRPVAMSSDVEEIAGRSSTVERGTGEGGEGRDDDELTSLSSISELEEEMGVKEQEKYGDEAQDDMVTSSDSTRTSTEVTPTNELRALDLQLLATENTSGHYCSAGYGLYSECTIIVSSS